MNIFLGLTVKDYASREGHSKVVNQLSMQKMSVMARTRSQENVLDDLDQTDKDQVLKSTGCSNNQKVIDAQATEIEKKEETTNLNIIKDSLNEKENESLIFSNEIGTSEVNAKEEQNAKENVQLSSSIIDDNEVKITKLDNQEVQNEIKNVTTDIVHPDDLIIENVSIVDKQVEKKDVAQNPNINDELDNCSFKPNNKVVENNKVIVEEKNTSVNSVLNKDEESVSQCTMPPPMEPTKSWDFIQTSIMHATDINEKTEKVTSENIVLIPDPIIGEVNTDDSELEWGSDESLPTDPNQTCNIVENKKEENKKKNTFYNFITTKLMNKNKNRVSASADSIIDDGSTTNKHVRNKSFSSLGTFKLTVPSDVNKALHQLSPEMNFAHSSFSKSKSFNERIENIDNNSLEFERSKSLCLELKHSYNASESQQRDSDSQSDDSLRSKRSLLLSMRMPKVHDEHHDDYHLDVKECETSEDEGPHYWYSPNKKNDKIVQQDTVIRNDFDSEDSE